MSYYKFAPGTEPDTFVFPTDNGWLYSVSFSNNSLLVGDNILLRNNQLSFEITFGRTALDNSVSAGKDAYVALTIQAILAKHFESQGELPLYFFLCDTSDDRGRSRSKLFNTWFGSCELPCWELVNYELQDYNDNTMTYYAGLFIHNGHPCYHLIPDAFAKFLEEDASSGKFIARR